MSRSTYLLKADAGEMSRWKASAASAGVSFAAWVREALDRSSVLVEAGEEASTEEAGHPAPSGHGERPVSREGSTPSPVPPASTSTRFDPSCRNADVHIDGKPCRWCGGTTTGRRGS